MRFAGDIFQPMAGYGSEQNLAMAYGSADKKEDQALLKMLTSGQLGSGPRIDESIKKVTDRLMGAPGSRIGY